MRKSITLSIATFISCGSRIVFASQWKEFPLATTLPLNSRANDSDEGSSNVPIVTSFKYNPPGVIGISKQSEYVDYIFGEKAMLYTDVDRKKLDKKPLTEIEFRVAKAQFKDAFKQFHDLADTAPACSIDMLAYLVPTEPIGVKIAKSFHDEHDFNSNGTMFIGTAQLTVTNKGRLKLTMASWKCYYRNLWRNGYFNLHQLVLFCPLPSLLDCQKFEASATKVGDGSHRKEIQLRMTMKPLVPKKLIDQVSKYPDWVSNFKAYIQPRTVYEASARMNRNRGSLLPWGKKLKLSKKPGLLTIPLTVEPPSVLSDKGTKQAPSPHMVVCSSAPYVTSIKAEKKHFIHKVMIKEFVKYYMLLGFRVIFYDRAGGHMSPKLKQLLDESIESQKKPNVEDRQYFVYKDFTIIEALVSTAKVSSRDNTSTVGVNRRQHYYDNTQDSLHDNWKLRYSTDMDKIVTYSQCRHEAEALWGIGNVLVVDFDEFLVCPAPGVPITAVGQRQYIQSLIARETALGQSFLLFLQRVPTNTTAESQVVCMAKKLRVAGGSIFQCYADYDAVVLAHMEKSMYLGYQCPHTSNHQSANIDAEGREFDCGDGKYTHVSTCGLMHLSTNPSAFNPGYELRGWSQEKIRQMRQPNNSELYRIMNS